MKKFITIFLVLICTLPAFSFVEISQTFYSTYSDQEIFSFDKSSFVKKAPDSELQVNELLGFRVSLALYPFLCGKHFDFGLGFDAGYTEADCSTKNFPLRATSFEADDLFASFGPSVRFNFNQKHSLALTPLFSFRTLLLGTASSSQTKEEMHFYCKGWFGNVNLAYKHWLFNATHVHLGLNAGIDIGFPIKYTLNGEITKYTYHCDGDYINYISDKGYNIKFFFGCCVNIGNRSIDKFIRRNNIKEDDENEE